MRSLGGEDEGFIGFASDLDLLGTHLIKKYFNSLFSLVGLFVHHCGSDSGLIFKVWSG
jgi:hypothetical protein